MKEAQTFENKASKPPAGARKSKGSVSVGPLQFLLVKLTECPFILIFQGWGRSKMCGATRNNKLAEVQLKIVSDEECRKAAGKYKKWINGVYTGGTSIRLQKPGRRPAWTPVC